MSKTAEGVRYVVSPENAGDTTLLWTCDCGTARVNFAWLTCRHCGEDSPAKRERDAGRPIR
jgi:hypothetical protein